MLTRCRSSMLLVILAFTAMANAQTEVGTAGTEVEHAPGFTFGSNVAGYLDLSTDICDIKTAIGDSATPNYASARAIYSAGKNSLKSDGTIRTLQELAAGPYTGEPVWDLYTEYYASPAFLTQPVAQAFAGTAPYTTVPVRNETIVKGLEAATQVVYMLHELDEAAAKIQNRSLTAAKGAPHNVDETWAIYAGRDPACSLWGTSNKRAKDFGTMEDCTTSKVNTAMAAAHNALYAAATDGDLAAFRQQQQEVQRLLLITYIQATLRYARLADNARAEGDVVTASADQAEGYMFFRTIEPLIAAANPTGARAIANALAPGRPAPRSILAIVQPALEATYADLNISPEDIGEYGAVQANLDCGAAAKTAAAAAAAAAGPARGGVEVAGADTTGNQISHATGFTFGSNVAGYLRLSTDICDIKKAIGTTNTPGYAAARAIYEDGKNSVKSDGSIRTLKGLATASYAGEPVWDMYARYYGTPAFLDQPVMAAFAGTAPYTTVPVRNETIVKGIESVLQTVYLLHELDEAAAKIRNKSLSAATGAPHNVDETWAIYVGERPDCSLWGASQKRAMEFGTMVDCSISKVNAAMLEAHRALYAAAAAGDLAAFQEQQRQVQRLFLITYIQATLKYAELLDKATAEGNQEQMQADQAEGYMFFRTIEPLIAAANRQGASAISNALNPKNPPPRNALAIVQPALEAAYSEYNISPADIGKFGSNQAQMAECAAAQPGALAAGSAAAAARSSAAAAGGSSFLVTLVAAVALLLALS